MSGLRLFLLVGLLLFGSLPSLVLAQPAPQPGTGATVGQIIGGAAAGGSGQNVFKVATDRANEVFAASFNILNILAMLAMLAVGGMAMTGRMPWGWAFAVMGALLLIQMAEPMQEWVLKVGDKGTVADIKGVTATVQGGGRQMAGDLRDILYAFGGLMIACLAILSMFGRFQWKWLAAVLGGMLIVANYTGVANDFTQTGNAVFDQTGLAVAKGEQTVKRAALQGQYVLYGLGGIGVIGVAAMAMMGRFSWNYLFALIGGLGLIAGISSGIQYVTGSADPLNPQLAQGSMTIN